MLSLIDHPNKYRFARTDARASTGAREWSVRSAAALRLRPGVIAKLFYNERDAKATAERGADGSLKREWK